MFSSSFPDIDDERMRKLIREELDRREKEKQDACNHRKSGTMLPKTSVVQCDECGKTLGQEDKDNAFDYSAPLSNIEERHVG